MNVYNIDVTRALPDGHPGRITMQRGNAFVARDRLDPDAIISRLYSSDLFQRFVARASGCRNCTNWRMRCRDWCST